MAKEKLANLSDVRRSNCKLIFETLYRNEGMTLLNLEHSTGLSRPTVVGMVRALEEEGLVRNIGKRESSGGRTPILYGINPEACYAVGIDFEFPVLRVAVSNLKGQIVGSSRKEFSPDLLAEKTISGLIEQVNEVVEKTGIEKKKILGIGLGMPGYINLKKGISLRFERIADWKNIEIVKKISEGTGMPVFMENDVHLLYRAECDLRKEKNELDVTNPDLKYSGPAIRLGKGWKVRPFIPIKAGETVVLADIKGMGTITEIFLPVIIRGFPKWCSGFTGMRKKLHL